jgi:hypothetical protein
VRRIQPWYRSTGGALPPGVLPTPGRSGFKSILLNANKYALTTWYNTARNFDAQAMTLKLIGSLAYRHKVNTSGGWGNE